MHSLRIIRAAKNTYERRGKCVEFHSCKICARIFETAAITLVFLHPKANLNTSIYRGGMVHFLNTPEPHMFQTRVQTSFSKCYLNTTGYENKYEPFKVQFE
jgi:hypothetical protein